MSVYRRHKETNFTCIDNHLFNDKTLSMKAKGLLAQILSLPDDWKYSVNGLASLFSDGRDAVNGAINELIEHGYITRTKIVNELGTFDGYRYDIYEKPQTEDGKIADIPFTDKPFTEEPFTDNSTVLNTNLLNTNIVNTNVSITPYIPRDDIPTSEEDMFEHFWAEYPQCFRKSNKKGCKAKFVKIKNLQAIYPDIIKSLRIQKKSKQWNEQDGQFIPAPLTWINQERWTVTDTRTERQEAADNILQSKLGDFLN